MKNAIFTLFLGGLMTVSAYASDVTVTLPNNRAYQVLIDGRGITNNNNYNNSVILNNLNPGQHSIEVYASNSRRNGNNRVYASNFTLRPQYDLLINVANNGQVQMNESRATDYGTNNGYGRNNGNDRRDRSDRDRRHDRDRDRDNDDDNRNNGNYGSNNGNYGTNNGNYGRGNGNYDRKYGNRGNNNYGNQDNIDYSRAMSDASFNQLVSNIRSAWFGKYNKAKTAVSQNYFTTYQVKQLEQIFSSESERLELAKLAYRNTVDQRNYYSLYDVFSSQNSRDELDRYIRSGGY